MDDPHQIAVSILSRLAKAWNAADGYAWGSEFADDADFVNIFGVQLKRRSQIEMRHQYVFDSLFADSRIEFGLADARLLAPNVMLAHSTAVTHIPSGPMAGELSTRQTMVITRDEAGIWRIAAYQNTQVTKVRHEGGRGGRGV